MKTKIYLMISAFFVTALQLKSQSGKILNELDPKAKTEKEIKPAPQTAGASQKTVEDKFNLKAHSDSLALLQKHTEELNAMSQKIRTDAKAKPESVKKLLILEAGNLEQQSQLTQIAASNLSSRINNYKFNKNKTTIKTYVAKTGEDNVPVYTKNLIFDSDKIMRLAKEMREEANAQPNVASKLGTMSNADEQEEVALSKQIQALTTLERASQNAISSQN